MLQATGLSDVKRDLLSRYMRGVASSKVGTIRRRPAGSAAPLSMSQAELYHRELRLHGIPPLHNECVNLRMLGHLDIVALEKSFNETIKRHELWRTTVETHGGQPVQIIHPAMPVELTPVDLQGVPEAGREEVCSRLVSADVCRPFDVRGGALIRPKLIRMNETEHRLFLTAHQMVLDGVSAYQIFPSELATFYKGFSSGKSVSLPEPKVQYADFAYWQNESLNGTATSQISYWRQQLASETPIASFPLKAQPIRGTFCGTIKKFSFPKTLSEGIKEFARQMGTTVFLVLLTGVATLLRQHTNQEEIVVGTLSPSGRKRSEVMGLLGYFLNPVILKFTIKKGTTFRELLSQAQGVLLDAMCHDDVPIERVARELGHADESSPSPFFSTVVSLQPPTPNLELPWTVTTMDVENGGSPWETYFSFIEKPEGFIGRVQYNSDLFDEATIECALHDLQNLLQVHCLEAVV